MQSRLGRSFWDAECFGDLRHGQVKVVAKDDRGSLVVLQAPEATLELVASGDVVARISHRLRRREHANGRIPSARAATRLRAGTDDELADPGVEPIGVAELEKCPPGLHERVLHRIFGTVDITEDRSGDREQPVASRDRERLEGLMITTLRRFDEVTLHVSLRCWRDRLAALTLYDGCASPNVHIRLPEGGGAVIREPFGLQRQQ